jgi:hypothetical protein
LDPGKILKPQIISDAKGKVLREEVFEMVSQRMQGNVRWMRG